MTTRLLLPSQNKTKGAQRIKKKIFVIFTSLDIEEKKPLNIIKVSCFSSRLVLYLHKYMTIVMYLKRDLT